MAKAGVVSAEVLEAGPAYRSTARKKVPHSVTSRLNSVDFPQGCSQKSIDTFSEAIKARAMALGTGHPDTVKLIHHVYGLIKKQVRWRTNIWM